MINEECPAKSIEIKEHHKCIFPYEHCWYSGARFQCPKYRIYEIQERERNKMFENGGGI